MDDNININFIIPRGCVNESSCSEDMQSAFVACEQYRKGGLQPKWFYETEYDSFSGLTKKDVFILNQFKGPLFETLKTTKSLILGPRCLLHCLNNGTSIPPGPEPVFTVAMRGHIVTASGFSKTEKEKIKEKVQWMGGTCCPVLTDETTHLISDNVLSEKYKKAVERGIPVMSVDWVEEVWKMSLESDVSGTATIFHKYLLPPFANLNVTSSGIAKREKQQIMTLVNENGGKFSGDFQSELTDVVVLNKNGIGSEKYKAAIEYKKISVTPAWVRDSAARGCALPAAHYKVTGASTSSPLTQHNLPDMSLNFSRITNVRPPSNFINETTRSTDASTMSSRLKTSMDMKRPSDPTSVPKEIITAFESFNMSDIKKAGPIFDGFCIWVSGVEGSWRERACACVSRGGGVRYDGPHERVTHAVAPSLEAAKTVHASLPRVPVLSPLWLLDSVRAKKVLPELQYLLEENNKSARPASAQKQKPEMASPMSKRNLQLLRPRQAPVTPPPAEEQAPDDLLQYLSQDIPEPVVEKTPRKDDTMTAVNVPPDVTEGFNEDPTEDIEQIFQGVKIEYQDLDEEALCEVVAEVSAGGGVLTNAGSGGSHVLVPLDYDVADVVNKDAEPVTVLWIKDCLSQSELVPIQYYHRPVTVTEAAATCLRGVVMSISTYTGVERAFLDEIAKLLGAQTQYRFCRRMMANEPASTHLLCPTPTGHKYAGAVKWGLPAVTAQWLMDCIDMGERLPEGPYLVGDTRAPLPPPEADRYVTPAKKAKDDVASDMAPPSKSTVGQKRQSAQNENRENTPLDKQAANDPDDMSPASRYIAMARLGLLGGDSQESPSNVSENKKTDEEVMRTPVLEDALSTPNLMALSPTTRRRLVAVRRGEMPSDPIATPVDPFSKGPATPDSAFGAALRPGSARLSPESRKRLWSVVQALPEKEQQQERSKPTPLSEIRNRFLAQFNDSPIQAEQHSLQPRKLVLEDHVDTPPAKVAKVHQNQTLKSSNNSIRKERSKDFSSASEQGSRTSVALPAGVDAQLQQLNLALSGMVSPGVRVRRNRDSNVNLQGLDQDSCPESQPNTVGWDDTTPQQKCVESDHDSVHHESVQVQTTIKRFMMSSNVDSQETIMQSILSLGGEVCVGTQLELDATHFLCAAPGRSEKMLGSVAAGKWVLHPAYITASRQHGAFLPEEQYEWGNEQATCLPPLNSNDRQLARAAYRWRLNRDRGQPGPYAGLKALLHVKEPRRKLLVRLVQAGGGEVPDIQSPYTNEDMQNVDVCFVDIKRFPVSDSDAALLKLHKIPVCPQMMLSSYLTEVERPRPEDFCIPEFAIK